MVHETIQYSQELSGEAQETCHRVQKSSLDPNVTVLNATKYASFMVIRIILQFNQFRFPEISGSFKTCHTFLGAPGRFPGSLNMFSGPPRTPATFPGQFPGLLLLEILIFNPRLVQCYEGKISILPSKEVKKMNQYAQETCQECQEVQESCLGIQETYY